MSQEYKVDLFDISDGVWLKEIILPLLPRVGDLISFSAYDFGNVQLKVTEIEIYVKEPHIEYYVSGIPSYES